MAVASLLAIGVFILIHHRIRMIKIGRQIMTLLVNYEPIPISLTLDF